MTSPRRLLARRGHWRGHPRRRRRPPDPGHARPRRLARPGHHRGPGQPAAAPAQPQRLGRPAELAGSEQTVRVLGNAPDAYALGETQISVAGGRVVRLSDLGTVSDCDRRIALRSGAQRQAGGQLQHQARARLFRPHRLRRARGTNCARSKRKIPRSTSSRSPTPSITPPTNMTARCWR